MRLAYIISIAALAASAPAPSIAAESSGDVTVAVKLTRERRDRLVAELRKELKEGERGVFYLLGGVENEELGEFRQASGFYYLTGLQTSGAGLLIHLTAESMSERLFLPKYDPIREKWTGPALSAGGVTPESAPDDRRRGAAEATGFGGEGRGGDAAIFGIEEMKAKLSGWLANGADVFFLDYEPPSLEGPLTGEAALAADVRARYPGIRVVSAGAALGRLRLVKSAEEVEAIRKAVSITCEAQKAAMRTMRPGLKEFDIEAVMEYVFTRGGARFPAFPTIVGSGPNSCTLHYSRNDRVIRDGDLVVIDAGAEFARYAADVTRTLPASGRFTDEQRRVYRAVLRAQSETKALVRPGAKISDLNARAKKVLDEEGLSGKMPHGCCHWVGLDVHDAGGYDALLAPGMVLTVEPGAYLAEKELGVRIEDTFLVTENGYEQLSACAPSDPDDLEKEMARSAPMPEFSPDASASRRR